MKILKRLLLSILIAFSAGGQAADYYTASGDPATGSALTSSVIRAEYSAIASGFAKIAPYTGSNNRLLFINSGATAQTTDAELTYNGTTNVLTVNGSTFGTNTSIGGTLGVTGVATFTAAPIYSALTASLPVFTDGSKGLVSNAMTGTGNVVMSASPTLTGTIGAASMTLSGTLNGNTITTGTGTLTLGAGSTLATSATNSITLTSTGSTNVTLPTTGTLATLAGTEELDNKTLDSSVGKGPWTASGTWTLPAVTLGGAVTVPTGVAVTGAGTASIAGFKSGSFGTAGNAGTVALLGATSGTATFSVDATSATVTLDKALTVSGATTLSAALTYGGVTLSNAVTGTGNMVLSASPTLTGTALVAALTASGAITANAGLTVASGQTLTLTGATVAGTPTWSSSQAITLSTAAQPNITSVGTLTGLTVSGNTTVGDGTGAPQLRIRGADASNSLLSFDKANSTGMWQLYRVATSHDFKIDSNSVNAVTITQAGAWNFGSNSLTAGAGSFTTGAFSGTITSTGSATVEKVAFSATGTTTAAHYASFSNTTGGLVVGVENSSGGTIIAGSTGYDAAISGKTGLAFSANNGAGMQMRLASTGASVTGTLSATGAFTESNNATAIGYWTTPAFSAGDFTGNSSMTWTVAAGDVATHAYTITGKTMTVNFVLNGTTVGGTPNFALQMAIPASKTATKAVQVPAYMIDNGTRGLGFASVAAGGTQISIIKSDASNWAASTDATYVYGSITFEIN